MYFSLSKIKDTSIEISRLIENVEDAYKKKYGQKRLSSKHKSIAYDICKQIVTNEPRSEWFNKPNDYVEGNFSLNSSVFDEISDI